MKIFVLITFKKGENIKKLKKIYFAGIIVTAIVSVSFLLAFIPYERDNLDSKSINDELDMNIQLLNSTINSQFLEESSDYFGGFLSFLPSLPLSIEKQEKYIFFENAYYAIKIIEYLSKHHMVSGREFSVYLGISRQAVNKNTRH